MVADADLKGNRRPGAAVSQFASSGHDFSRADQACFTRASAPEVSLASFGLTQALKTNLSG